MLDTADHCSYLYTGWSGSASGLSGLSTHAGCGFPHTGKTWCTPIFFTQKKNPDQVITSSIIEGVFRNIFDSIYWKNHYKKIFKSQNTGKCFAGITFILKLILLYITTTSQKCNVDYLVLLLACWDTLNWENYFRSFSLSFCFQFIFSQTANKQEEEYSHWWSAPFFLLLVFLYDLLQFSDQQRTYLYARDLCMYVLSLLIYSPSTSFINTQSNIFINWQAYFPNAFFLWTKYGKKVLFLHLRNHRFLFMFIRF